MCLSLLNICFVAKRKLETSDEFFRLGAVNSIIYNKWAGKFWIMEEFR